MSLNLGKPQPTFMDILDLVLLTPCDLGSVSGVREFISNHAIVCCRLDLYSHFSSMSNSFTFQMHHEVKIAKFRSKLSNCSFVQCPS